MRVLDVHLRHIMLQNEGSIYQCTVKAEIRLVISAYSFRVSKKLGRIIEATRHRVWSPFLEDNIYLKVLTCHHTVHADVAYPANKQ